MKKKIIWPARYSNFVLVGVGILLAGLVRFNLRGFVSIDYIIFTGSWYSTIKDQGFIALQSGFANYTPLYLYFLYFVSRIFPFLNGVFATKLPSMVADFICAWFAYRIVRLKYGKDSPVPIFSFFAILFAPTILMNSSFWGQADSIFTAGLVACLYFLLIGRQTSALLAFGIAFALKLQAVFLIPFLLILSIKKIIAWKQWLILPLVYFVTVLPVWILGRPLPDLLNIYFEQANLYQYLTLEAPNLYAWLPEEYYSVFYPSGLILGISICFLLFLIVFKSRVRPTPSIMIQLALVSVLLVPYFFPKMHERYFFPADVISIIYGFAFPAFFYIPLIIQAVSFFAYQPFLFKTSLIPMPILAIILFVVIIIVLRQMLISLYRDNPDDRWDSEANKATSENTMPPDTSHDPILHDG